MLDTETIKCDFCKSNNLELIYSVPTSKKGADVYICEKCNLVQSIYKNKTSNLKRIQSLSSDADWGNIRHGKKTRLSLSLNILNKFIQLDDIKSVLDIGSNRGHFVNYIISHSNTIEVDAIEPDTNILEEYSSNHRLSIHKTRFENFASHKKYDLIYCCHTLEHADSASLMLGKIYDLLSENGVVYIDVPDLAMIEDIFNVQEFFIDKHKFHFSKKVLINYLIYLGFNVIDQSYESRNIILVCTKNRDTNIIKQKIQNYIQNLITNRELLNKASKYIQTLSKENTVAIYGASQILDAMIKYGNLDLSQISYLIDDFLCGYIDSVQNKSILNINNLQNKNIDYMILLTKSSTGIILEKLKLNNINIKHSILLEDLFKEMTYA